MAIVVFGEGVAQILLSGATYASDYMDMSAVKLTVSGEGIEISHTNASRTTVMYLKVERGSLVACCTRGGMRSVEVCLDTGQLSRGIRAASGRGLRGGGVASLLVDPTKEWGVISGLAVGWEGAGDPGSMDYRGLQGLVEASCVSAYSIRCTPAVEMASAGDLWGKLLRAVDDAYVDATGDSGGGECCCCPVDPGEAWERGPVQTACCIVLDTRGLSSLKDVVEVMRGLDGGPATISVCEGSQGARPWLRVGSSSTEVKGGAQIQGSFFVGGKAGGAFTRRTRVAMPLVHGCLKAILGATSTRHLASVGAVSLFGQGASAYPLLAVHSVNRNISEGSGVYFCVVVAPTLVVEEPESPRAKLVPPQPMDT